MKTQWIKAQWMKPATVAATLGVLLASVALAQPPHGPHDMGGPHDMHGPHGFGGPEGMRNNPKMHLGFFLVGVGHLEKSGKAKLSAHQAKQIVAAISPWRNKPSMSDAQAKALDSRLGGVLTAAQKKELQAMRPPHRDGRDGHGEGDHRGGPDGHGGPGGGDHHGDFHGDHRGGPGGFGGKPPTDAQRKEMRARMEKMRTFFGTYNPFYPPAKYASFKQMPSRMQDGFKRHYAEQSALLSQLAKKAAKA